MGVYCSVFLVVFRIAPKYNSFNICKYTIKKPIILYIMAQSFQQFTIFEKKTTFASLANLLLTHFGSILALIVLMVSWLTWMFCFRQRSPNVLNDALGLFLMISAMRSSFICFSVLMYWSK